MTRAQVQKGNVVLDKLAVEYVPVDSVKPNSYNPNRQSEHDFELLCKSIQADGFTQPIIVQRDTREIVDGEHRWRACRALGFAEVPVVFTKMTAEQARIATLRHNRARGTEDAALAADILRELAAAGALELAKAELMLDDVEVHRLLTDMPTDELKHLAAPAPPAEMLGPSGRGLSELDQQRPVELSADARRAQERILAQAKGAEEKRMTQADQDVFRLNLVFTDQEAVLVREELRALGAGDAAGQPGAVLELCRRAASRRAAAAG